MPAWSCRMLRELRFAHWEALVPLPRMEPQGAAHEGGPNGHWQAGVLAQQAGASPDAPDLKACVLHQKLQMLNCCILVARHPEAAFITLSIPPAGSLSGNQAVKLRMPQLVTSDLLAEREAALTAAGDHANCPPLPLTAVWSPALLSQEQGSGQSVESMRSCRGDFKLL